MKYVTGAQAARELGVSYQTIYNWIVKGKISTRKSTDRKVAIPHTEILRLKQERSLFEEEETDQATQKEPDLSALHLEIEDLQQRVSQLENQLVRIRLETPVQTLTDKSIPEKLPVQKRTTETNINTLPENAILIPTLANTYRVPESSIRRWARQYETGIQHFTSGGKEQWYLLLEDVPTFEAFLASKNRQAE